MKNINKLIKKDRKEFVKKILQNKKHSFHLVKPSPWPFLTSISLFIMLIGTVMYLHFYNYGLFTATVGFLFLITILTLWWRDVIREATFEGFHTEKVQKGIKFGFILFIITEVMFFFGFFWALLYLRLNADVMLSGLFPPEHIKLPNTWGIPLLNTILLLTSGVFVTLAHKTIKVNKHNSQKKIIWVSLLISIILGVIFTFVQASEYIHLSFDISAGAFSTCFYLLTGFHGLHVIIGTIFLIVSLIRFILGHFSITDHLGLELAIFYWHFVDVVWLILLILVYIW